MISDPRPPDVAGIGEAAWRRAAWGRVWIAVTLAVMDLALISVAVVAWQAAARDQVADVGVAPISIMGIGAAAGAGVLSVLMGANVSAIRAGRAARPAARPRLLAHAGAWLAVVRLVALAAAVVAVAVAGGASESVGLAESCTIAIGGLDALAAVLLAWRTSRGVRADAW